EKLAEKLRVPFGYLFLPTPPEETIPLPDFRTVGGTGLSSPTADFMDLLYDVLAKHLWYRELLENEGRTELTFVASFNLDARPEDVAANISATLGITDEVRSSCTTWETFLRTLIGKAEAHGILVMR